jgi:hypothetical protein
MDYEAPEGRRFRDAFDLSFGSVVVQRGAIDGRWENLPEVWTLINGELAAFDAYVTDCVRAFLSAVQ